MHDQSYPTDDLDGGFLSDSESVDINHVARESPSHALLPHVHTSQVLITYYVILQ